MCGIIAFKTKKKTTAHIQMLLKLIRESKIRGLHSFGYSYVTSKILTQKFFALPIEIDDFAQSLSNEFIYHNRYCTSGDWSNPNNNQPLNSKRFSIAMNGVISMKPKEEYEQEYDIKCYTENDSEVFLRLLEKGNSPESIIKKIGGSCAVVWLDIDKNVFAIRNKDRPLHYFIKDKAAFVCSTADIAQRALKVKTKEISPYKLLKLNELI
jgi:glutamine phosphoribosylpyrophosphate amidotransferase